MQQFLDTALKAARAADEVSMAYFRGEFDVEIKEDQTPVTIADRRAEAASRQAAAHKELLALGGTPPAIAGAAVARAPVAALGAAKGAKVEPAPAPKAPALSARSLHAQAWPVRCTSPVSSTFRSSR